MSLLNWPNVSNFDEVNSIIICLIPSVIFNCLNHAAKVRTLFYTHVIQILERITIIAVSAAKIQKILHTIAIWRNLLCFIRRIVLLLQYALQKFTHKGGNLRMMAFKGEVAAGDEVDFGIGQVTLESIGSSRDE